MGEVIQLPATLFITAVALCGGFTAGAALAGDDQRRYARMGALMNGRVLAFRSRR
jgi:hypothetical protein